MQAKAKGRKATGLDLRHLFSLTLRHTFRKISLPLQVRPRRENSKFYVSWRTQDNNFFILWTRHSILQFSSRKIH